MTKTYWIGGSMDLTKKIMNEPLQKLEQVIRPYYMPPRSYLARGPLPKNARIEVVYEYYELFRIFDPNGEEMALYLYKEPER